MLRKTLTAFVVALIATTGALAEESLWALCGDVPPPPASYPETSSDDPLELTADQGLFDRSTGQGLFTGNARAIQGGRSLSADTLRYYQFTEKVEAEGNILFSDRGFSLSAPEARMLLDTGDMEAFDARYGIEQRHARGRADYALRDEPGVVELRNATFTTCPVGKSDWSLYGKDVTLDQKKGVGSAWHALFRIKDVPVFYTPYAQFPLDNRRRTGFLIPSYGSTSKSGVEVVVPYYFNLAPNYDATLTARLLSERGVQWRPEFRYLFPGTEGEVHFEVLPDSKAEETRTLIDYSNSTRITDRWSSSILYTSVSDDRYFEDLGNSIEQTSQSFLQRRADLFYNGGFWNLLSRVQELQTIDPSVSSASLPYARLPQFLLTARRPEELFGLGLDFRGEFVNFDRDDSVTGGRLDGLFKLERPLVRPGYFLKPQANFRFTGYGLRDTVPGDPVNPTRTIPTLSLDSGLVFEKPLFAGNMIQTLEPRAYYLYTPFVDQDDIPVFDTSQFDFTFAQMFRDNRFTSADRVGDANQVTLALSSSFIDPTEGIERASVGVGQIVYFKDREVTLPGRAPETNGVSNLVVDGVYQINPQWRIQANTQWDPFNDRLERTSARLRYRSHGRRLFNLGYSARVGQFEQADVSLVYPLTSRWLVVGRWNYDFFNERSQDILAGIEYDSCCWAARLVGRRFISGAETNIGDDSEYSTSIQFQFVLKGLTELGNNIDELLERNIIGFDSPY
ncbi:MAG: LPS assembly protein LptD [Pseudomonadota bacterium]|nr:LPS assembly protein LptD [Pseudomonadota bacterium]